MEKFHVAEKFVSINGEGTRAGQLAVFVRFTGCGLSCSYCDTKWANEKDAPFTPMTAQEIYSYIKETGVTNVTLTGGEPLMQSGIGELISMICADSSLYCEIETNGAVSIAEYAELETPPAFTMDYKLPSSGMEGAMLADNFKYLTKKDTVKFVSGSEKDLERAKEIMEQYSLYGKVSLYISPVFGKIEPAKIVEFMKINKLNGVNLQLQMHKIIWSPDMKGV